MGDRGAFDSLINEAEALTFSGWDFGFLRGRWEENATAWDYRAIVQPHLAQATALLDMGTGGGELLQSLVPLPPYTAATEGYAPNIPVARARLTSLGVDVRAIEDDALPFDDATFDLVINRHESFDPTEVRRVLQPGGVFITQQVGGMDLRELNDALGDTSPLLYAHWSLDYATDQLRQANFIIQKAEEDFSASRFYDIGAVVAFLRVVPWQLPNFTVAAYRDRLLHLHQQIARDGALVARSHRFLIVARKPVATEGT